MKRWVALAALGLVAAACGETGQTGTPSPSPSVAASKTPVASGQTFKFSLKGEPGVKASGTITLTVRSPRVTIEVSIKDLQANSSHITHIHLGGCLPSQRGGIAYALNQVIADGQGMSMTRTTFTAVYPPRTARWYMVVHAGSDMQGSNATYLLCGNMFS